VVVMHSGWSSLRGLIGVVAVSVLLCLAASPASAQGAVNYERLIEEGLIEFSEGNWIEAYDLFRQAHAINPNARTLRGMGMSSFEMRRYAAAIRHLRGALDSGKQPLDAEQQKQVADLIERTSRLVGTLIVEVDPPDATVLLDGHPMEHGRELVRVGEATVVAEKAGVGRATRRVHIKGGEEHRVVIKLDSPLSPSAAAAAQPAQPREAAPDRRDPVVAPSPTDGEPAGEEDSNLWVWLTVGTGAAVTAAVVTILLLSGDDESGDEVPPGNLGFTVSALEAP